jgi:hypothetical protein
LISMDAKIDTKYPIIIAGSGRSGTTWVLDSLAKENKLRTIFEPFNPTSVKEVTKFVNKFVEHDYNDKLLYDLIEKILSGRMHNIWIDYRIRPERLCYNKDIKTISKNYINFIHNYINYRKVVKRKNLIVKFIRANLLLSWIAYNFKVKIAFVLRHPCAVISSKIKLNTKDWSHQKLLFDYLNDPLLCEKYRRFIEKINKYYDYNELSDIEGHAIIWCIENKIPTENENNCIDSFIYYEKLLKNGRDEWIEISNKLCLKKIPDMSSISEPSQQVSLEMKNKKFDINQINKWKSIFSNEELLSIQKILEIFEIEHYNIFSTMPSQEL